MRAVYALLVSAAVITRCVAIEPAVGTWAESARVPIEAIEVGRYTPEEVQHLRAALANLSFPAPEGTVAALLPHPIRAIPFEFSDGYPDHEKKGRIGGYVVIYWLSEVFALRVATAYYVEGEKRFSREEWAVILSTAENTGFARRIY